MHLIIAVIAGFNPFYGQTKSSNYDTYKVVAYNQNNHEVISESNTVEVMKKIKVHIPNAFSPDGDGINDNFKIVAEGIESFQLKVFNRWGEVVFESNDIKNQWDGTFKGKLSQNDAYVYVVDVTGADFIKSSSYKGTVSLLH